MNASWSAQYSRQRIAEFRQHARGGQLVRARQLDRATSGRAADAVGSDLVAESSWPRRVAIFMNGIVGRARRGFEGGTRIAPYRRQLRSVEHS